MFTADQLVLHAIGDYVIQSDWMANSKTKQSAAAAAHAITYSLPFLFLTRSPAALLVICVTHFVIDRWRLARYACWVKNFLGPRSIPVTWREENPDKTLELKYVRNYPWSQCSGTGYFKDRPAWMSVWLMIIADNVFHVICNGLAIRFLG